jgi:hypothetical protein
MLGNLNHLEYFSEIDNQDVDEDSLFDPVHNFLQPSGPPGPHQPMQQPQHSYNYLKKQGFPSKDDGLMRFIKD